MGWDGEYESPREILARTRQDYGEPYTRPGETDSRQVTDLCTTNRGLHIWGVYRESGKAVDIFFRLIEGRPRDGGKPGIRFWYKTLAGSEYPYYFDCPTRLLDKLHEDALTEIPLEWRLAVYAHHERVAVEREAKRRGRTVNA